MKKNLSLCVALLMAVTCSCSFTTDFELPEDTTDDAVSTDSSDTSTDPSSNCSGCLIQGFCFPEGVINPQNICQVCAPGAAVDTWSDNDGQICDDGLFCTEADSCSASECGGTVKDCDDGIVCTGTETCDDVIDECVIGATTCVGGSVCHLQLDVCVPTCTGCLIDSLCYVDTQIHSTNKCLACDVSVSASQWTVVSDGANCDDSDYCTTGETCTLGNCGGGTPRLCDDGVACNGTETCNSSAQQCLSGTTTCSGGELCDTISDQCVAVCTGCNILGSCYGVSQDNPVEDCEFCQTASDTDWTPKSDGVLCSDGGGSCLTGTCCTGCSISGTCYNQAEDNPAEDCQLCDTAQDQSDWTDKTDGIVCAGGSCLTGTCCTGCSISGTCYNQAEDNPAEDCQLCDTAQDQSDWTDKTDGIVCAGGSCLSGTCCTGCSISGSCYTDTDVNPTEECQICEVISDQSDWTNLPDTTPCNGGSGDTCTDGVCGS